MKQVAMIWTMLLVLFGSAEVAIAQTAETWVDPRTRLIWTTRDNGSQISGEQAVRFCKDLVLAGYSDWRSPEIDELAGIYDPSLTNFVKIKPPIILSGDGLSVWSESRGVDFRGPIPSYWLFQFFNGGRVQADLRMVISRALCVHNPR